MYFIADLGEAKGVSYHGVDVPHQVAVDDLHQVVAGDVLQVVADDHHRVVDDVPLHVVLDVLFLEVGLEGDDPLGEDPAQCYLLLMGEDDQMLHLADLLAGALTQPSNQRVGPIIHQISFFACHCRVPSVVENVPD